MLIIGKQLIHNIKKLEMKKSISIIILFFLAFSSCKKKDPTEKLQIGPVQIEGSIKNYKGLYKTGKLTYFDAVTRIVNDEIFPIDSMGNFFISFDLIHPISGSIFLEIEDDFYSNFYVKPYTSYTVNIKSNKLVFKGKSGLINNQISIFKDSLNRALGSKIKEANLYYKKGLKMEQYLLFQKQIENAKIAFLNNYQKKNPFSEKVFQMLMSEITFKTAHAWINYRYDYTTTGKRTLKHTLPTDFYKNIFTEHPITTQSDYQSRACIDYISNFVTVLTEKGNTVKNRIAFYKSTKYFSAEELKIVSKLYNGDKKIRTSEEYKKFKTKQNIAQLRKLNFRYNVNTLLNNISKYPQNIGRDLIVSQAISKAYFSNNIRPTSLEWALIDNVLANKFILKHLQNLSIQKTSEEPLTKAKNETLSKLTTEVKAKYINKYLGKVIYIDFYATWCGPCREEIPYAKSLHHEFENKGVVFLNLCAQSEKEDWKNMIKQHKIKGEHYLLNKEEFDFLQNIYKIKGFPTYILIDKKGNVADYAAPRPSSKQTIIEAINKLIK